MVASAPVVPRCLTIAGSDSGGGAGIQADLKAFARLGCHGMTAIVALTAQNTREVTAIHEVPVGFVRAQLQAAFEDIGVDAAKTGMLFSAPIIETVAAFLEAHPVPLVVDPVMVAASGARLLREDAVTVLTERLFPLATVVTPNLREASELAGAAYTEDAERGGLAEAIHASRRSGRRRHRRSRRGGGRLALRRRAARSDPVDRHEDAATHGAGCTHSACLAALLARGEGLEDAARGAAAIASEAVRNGLAGLGAGSGPVDVIGLANL